ncbi:MAG: hypothetical protein ABUT20_35830 [Bacteroidota bacterium]
MKRLLLLPLILFVISLRSFSQAKLGEVACVYVTTSDLDSSSSVYEKIGFQKIASNTFPVPWAQVSDGSLLIMMRKDATPYIGLTYYVTDIENVAAQLEKEGIVFTQKPKNGDAIKRYYFKSPDGFNIMLASNLGAFQQPKGITMLDMKPADFAVADKYPNKQCGVFGEFCHPVTDLNSSIVFWKKIGFTVKSQMTAPYPYAILSDGLMLIGLHQTKDFNYPAVTYFGLNTEKRIQHLKEQGLKNFTEMMGKNNQVFNSWEGQHFFLFSLGM